MTKVPFELQGKKAAPRNNKNEKHVVEEAAYKLFLNAFEIPQTLAMIKRKSLNTVQ